MSLVTRVLSKAARELEAAYRINPSREILFVYRVLYALLRVEIPPVKDEYVALTTDIDGRYEAALKALYAELYTGPPSVMGATGDNSLLNTINKRGRDITSPEFRKFQSKIVSLSRIPVVVAVFDQKSDSVVLDSLFEMAQTFLKNELGPSLSLNSTAVRLLASMPAARDINLTKIRYEIFEEFCQLAWENNIYVNDFSRMQWVRDCLTAGEVGANTIGNSTLRGVIVKQIIECLGAAVGTRFYRKLTGGETAPRRRSPTVLTTMKPRIIPINESLFTDIYASPLGEAMRRVLGVDMADYAATGAQVIEPAPVERDPQKIHL